MLNLRYTFRDASARFLAWRRRCLLSQRLLPIRERRDDMKLRLAAMTGGMLVLATTAFALPTMMKVFDSTYKPGKNLKKADCAICHVAKGKTKLNPYGEEIKKA